MFYLHRRTPSGVHHFMGEFETDYVEYAFRDCVNDHTNNDVWIATDTSIPYSFNRIISYNPDLHNYETVDDWDYSILQTFLTVTN